MKQIKIIQYENSNINIKIKEMEITHLTSVLAAGNLSAA